MAGTTVQTIGAVATVAEAHDRTMADAAAQGKMMRDTLDVQGHVRDRDREARATATATTTAITMRQTTNAPSSRRRSHVRRGVTVVTAVVVQSGLGLPVLVLVLPVLVLPFTLEMKDHTLRNSLATRTAT